MHVGLVPIHCLSVFCASVVEAISCWGDIDGIAKLGSELCWPVGVCIAEQREKHVVCQVNIWKFPQSYIADKGHIPSIANPPPRYIDE